MTKNEFNHKFKGEIGPSYYGAKHPPFNPAAINEKNFPNELRVKDLSTNFIEGFDGQPDKIHFKWVSMQWNDGIDSVVKEIKRCLKFIGFIGWVELEIYERGMNGSGSHEDYIEFEV